MLDERKDSIIMRDLGRAECLFNLFINRKIVIKEINLGLWVGAAPNAVLNSVQISKKYARRKTYILPPAVRLGTIGFIRCALGFHPILGAVSCASANILR